MTPMLGPYFMMLDGSGKRDAALVGILESGITAQIQDILIIN